MRKENGWVFAVRWRGDPLLAEELIALGVDEWSMTPMLIPKMKHVITGMKDLPR